MGPAYLFRGGRACPTGQGPWPNFPLAGWASRSGVRAHLCAYTCNCAPRRPSPSPATGR